MHVLFNGFLREHKTNADFRIAVCLYLMQPNGAVKIRLSVCSVASSRSPLVVWADYWLLFFELISFCALRHWDTASEHAAHMTWTWPSLLPVFLFECNMDVTNKVYLYTRSSMSHFSGVETFDLTLLGFKLSWTLQLFKKKYWCWNIRNHDIEFHFANTEQEPIKVWRRGHVPLDNSNQVKVGKCSLPGFGCFLQKPDHHILFHLFTVHRIHMTSRSGPDPRDHQKNNYSRHQRNISWS